MSNSRIVTVSSAAQLSSALKVATSGETILLSTGNYGALNFSGMKFTGAGVTIAAASSTADAVITSMHISNSSGITLSGLDLNGASSTQPWAFQIGNSSDITLTGLKVHATTKISGLMLQNNTNVSISNSTFSNLADAIADMNNNGVSISNNHFSNIGGDGIDNGGTSNVSISNNTFTDFLGGTATQHPDAIQFWTTNTTQSASNITVSNNTISVGSGAQIQGILISDQVGNLPYHNVTITGNTITGEMYDGILVQDAQNVVANNNIVTGLSHSGLTLAATSTYATSSTSWIVMKDVAGLSMAGNDSSAYVLTDNTGVNLGVNSVDGVAQQKIVYSDATAVLSILQNTLVLTGNKAINGSATTGGQTIDANSGGDRLYDNPTTGNDTLNGGSGNDWIVSRGVNDTLSGGGGNNTFQVEPATKNSGTTTITDFLHTGSHNALDLNVFLADGMHPTLTNSGANTIVSFSGTAETIMLLGVHTSDLTSTATGFASHI